MKRNIKTLSFTLFITFILMSLLVFFTTRVIFKTAFSLVQEVGDDKTSAITADVENYLENAKSVLWVAADTVDHMVAEGATEEEIIEYITRESKNTERQFDDSYTGLYGVLDGQYIDGVGWVPPDDYDYTTRDWYITTCAAKGEPIIVSPYVDAQTGNVIISIGKSLTNPKNALALDLTLSEVQEMVEDIQINGYGYGFILNNDGMVIAHPDKKQNGTYYNVYANQREFFDKIVSTGKGNFTTTIEGKKCTVFVDDILNQWHLVIITENSDLFRAPTNLMIVSIIVNLIVFALISLFYILSYRVERNASISMELMKQNEIKKDYEAKLLMLEKTAADSANKAKSDFLADMSHEIRTPINAILGMNEMILHETKEKEILDYASNIKSAGNTLLSIINSILDFSKIEDGRMHLVPAEFDITELINGLYNSISERAKKKNLDLIFNIDETIPSRLLGDDVRISQVIMNLLTNAVKYTEKGRVICTFKNLGLTDNKDLKLLVSVKDTGIGIEQKNIDRLSISFERVDEMKNRHIEGTGLGISIVTKLLAMMKSELKIKSEYGVGSEFYFELPLSVVDSSPIGFFDVSRSASSAGKSVVSKISLSAPDATILVTDDNEMNCKVAESLMKLFKIKPTICTSGKKAIELMEKNEYDILFLDHMMPEMDGIETLKVLKAKNLVKNSKVIALTANAVVGAKEQYMEVGFDDYLSKPIDLGELEKLLYKYLPEEKIEEADGESIRDTDEVIEFTENSNSNDAVQEKIKSSGDISKNRKTSNDEVIEFNAENTGDMDSKTSETNAVTSSPAGTDIKLSVAERIKKASSLNLDVKQALTFCGEDETFYLELLNDYSESSEEKLNNLTGFLKEENMKDYRILVHSLKSSSKTIGAMKLFEQARALEEAAADDNIEFIKLNHIKLVKAISELSEKLKEV